MTVFIPLTIFVILDTALFGYACNKVNAYRRTLNDGSMKEVMTYTLYTLITGVIGFYILSIDLVNQLGKLINDIMYVTLFFSFLGSAVSIIKASRIFFNAYAHIGHEHISKILMYGYIPFFGIPMTMLLFLGESIAEIEILLQVIVAGFYFWNFVSDTVMDVLSWNRLERLQYAIGSDIAASRDAKIEVKRLLTWKAIVSVLVFILLLGVYVVTDYNTIAYVTVISLGLLFPANGLLMMHRLMLVERLLKIPMGSPVEESQAQAGMTELHVIA